MCRASTLGIVLTEIINSTVAGKPVGSALASAVESLRVAKASFNHPGVQPAGLCSPEWFVFVKVYDACMIVRLGLWRSS
ncbi:MAG: hypothetical protein B6D61_05760 [Bacteroidetes bacterium 4484_249]|nr:MAG: hypothetical protein B6D61_05760 [Bacteroidetes bacterium 4484_249]